MKDNLELKHQYYKPSNDTLEISGVFFGFYNLASSANFVSVLNLILMRVKYIKGINLVIIKLS